MFEFSDHSAQYAASPLKSNGTVEFYTVYTVEVSCNATHIIKIAASCGIKHPMQRPPASSRACQKYLHLSLLSGLP
jgi:hypothetical protein